MKKLFQYILAIVILAALLTALSPTSGGSSTGKRKYGDLSDVEKANAKWAYEAKQAIDSYGR